MKQELKDRIAKVGIDEAIVEQIAEKIHDQWAQERRSNGWIYGPTRDDQKKHHPCLVPYDDLTDDEKEYDRISAITTLEQIAAAGFTVYKKTDPMMSYVEADYFHVLCEKLVEKSKEGWICSNAPVRTEKGWGAILIRIEA